MPGSKQYPADRVSGGKSYEKGGVSQGNKPISKDGSESHTSKRAGNSHSKRKGY